MGSFRDLSPASTDRFRQSVSLSTAPSPNIHTHDPDPMQIDEVVVREARQDVNLHRKAAYSQETRHPTVKPAILSELAPSFTEFGSICLPNIVQFEFRLLTIWGPTYAIQDRTVSNENLILQLLFSFAIDMSKDQIQQLVTLWTQKNPRLLSLSPRSITTLCFQTYLDQSNWQIKRVLNCIIWKTRLDMAINEEVLVFDSRDSSPQCCEIGDLEVAILESQEIYGRESAWYALGDVGLVLLPNGSDHGPRWMSFDEACFPNDASSLLTDLKGPITKNGYMVDDITIMRSLSQINPPSEIRQNSTLPDLKEGMPEGNSMLVIRPPLWPEVCSKFCLFVLLDEVAVDRSLLYQLLQEAKKGRYYTSGECRLDPEDRKTLHKWSMALL
jgi:hypothetical protein